MFLKSELSLSSRLEDFFFSFPRLDFFLSFFPTTREVSPARLPDWKAELSSDDSRLTDLPAPSSNNTQQPQLSANSGLDIFSSRPTSPSPSLSFSLFREPIFHLCHQETRTNVLRLLPRSLTHTMDPQGDVAGSFFSLSPPSSASREKANLLSSLAIAIFVALFDDVQGQVLHGSSLFNEGVDLKGLEFSGQFNFSLALSLSFPLVRFSQS